MAILSIHVYVLQYGIACYSSVHVYILEYVPVHLYCNTRAHVYLCTAMAILHVCTCLAIACYSIEYYGIGKRKVGYQYTGIAIHVLQNSSYRYRYTCTTRVYTCTYRTWIDDIAIQHVLEYVHVYTVYR